MLHIIKSQSTVPVMDTYYQNGDVLLLMEDAVYCANLNHHYFRYLSGRPVFCLEPDIQARSLRPYIAQSIQVITYPEFVDLTVNHFPSMTWN